MTPEKFLENLASIYNLGIEQVNFVPVLAGNMYREKLEMIIYFKELAKLDA